ncbi:hypothetical protein GOP47_0026935 [Adiantum capillus-veneris]|nr:hypothetical protein GOP47_0026935 [Adiantum capillus-veneris]
MAFNRAEIDQTILQQALSLVANLPSSSSSAPRSFPASPSSSSSSDSDVIPSLSTLFFDPDAEQNDDLEDLCRNEFGLKLVKVRTRLRAQAEEQQSALQHFCEDVRRTRDPARRREIAKAFIMELVEINKLATDRTMHTLVKMQTFFLANVQTENEMLVRDISRFENEVADLSSALQMLEMEKQGIVEDSRSRFEEEKGILEVTLREELQACQICLRNPRNIVIMPCLHGQFCGECMEVHQKNNRTCPTCRGVIRGTLPYIA